MLRQQEEIKQTGRMLEIIERELRTNYQSRTKCL